MLRTKEILAAVGTLGCAIGIGFVMQKSDAAQAHYGSGYEEPAMSLGPVERDLRQQQLEDASKNAMLDVTEITFTSAGAASGLSPAITLPDTDDGIRLVSARAGSMPQPMVDSAPTIGATPVAAEVETSEAEIEMVEAAPVCDIIAEARPVAAAMVDVTLSAPCYPNERVTLHHNGMIFTETTSDEGGVNMRLPALAMDAVFILAFSNGEGAVAQAYVEELADYDRAVLQWKGDVGFEIHAREFGADYGSEGHIWTGRPGDIVDAATGAHGVITRHGDVNAPDPLLAEVYTFPKGLNEREGRINLSVEAEVSDRNCGLEIEAQSLELQPTGEIKTQNLTLAVPDCDAKGSFLVLNNLLQDLKVASK